MKYLLQISLILVSISITESRLSWSNFRNKHDEKIMEKEIEEAKEESAAIASEDESTAVPLTTKEEEEEFIVELAERMKPRNFYQEAVDAAKQSESESEKPALVPIPPKQFFHLHHMKSGGTSLNSHLRCGQRRAAKKYGTKSTPYRLSECAFSAYQNCISNPENSCHARIAASSQMEYCAPLSISEEMGWHEADAVTMIRHPVDRVWSMFRFQTKRCFACKTLKEVYEIMDGLNSTNTEDTGLGGGVCLTQLTNHMTRNLQSKIQAGDDLSRHNDVEVDAARLEDALYNLRNRFTVIGMLEHLDDTVDLMAHSFPWMSPVIEGDDVECYFPKHNSSPTNNRCGEHGTHWDLPDHPDDETRKLIEEHNKLDMKLYEAAVEHFEMQKKAVEYYKGLE